MPILTIYTRAAWLSYFNRYPCIVIDGDEIYDGDEYRLKLIKYPIGYIKPGRNGVREIYGAEYRTKLICYPVGYLKEGLRGVLELYNEEYRTRHIVYPIGYIKGNEYYTYDDFHRFFSYPTYYIEKE